MVGASHAVSLTDLQPGQAWPGLAWVAGNLSTHKRRVCMRPRPGLPWLGLACTWPTPAPGLHLPPGLHLQPTQGVLVGGGLAGGLDSLRLPRPRPGRGPPGQAQGGRQGNKCTQV